MTYLKPAPSPLTSLLALLKGFNYDALIESLVGSMLLIQLVQHIWHVEFYLHLVVGKFMPYLKILEEVMCSIRQDETHSDLLDTCPFLNLRGGTPSSLVCTCTGGGLCSMWLPCSVFLTFLDNIMDKRGHYAPSTGFSVN